MAQFPGWAERLQRAKLTMPLGSGPGFPAMLPDVAPQPSGGGGFSDYLRGLRDELDSMLQASQGPQSRAGRAFENAALAGAAIGEGAETTGGNIALVANALLGLPMARQQRRLQEAMMPLQGLAPMMELQKGYLDQQKTGADIEQSRMAIAKSQAEISALPVELAQKRALTQYYGDLGAQARAVAGRPVPQQEIYSNIGTTPYALPGQPPRFPRLNTVTGQIEGVTVEGLGAGAMPVEQATTTGNTDTERYLSRFITAKNADRANAGQPPLSPQEEEIVKAEAFQKLAGVRAGISQEMTGGVSEANRVQMQNEMAAPMARLRALMEASMDAFKLRSYAQANKIPATEALTAVQNDIMEAVQEIELIQSKYVRGAEPPSTPQRDPLDIRLEELERKLREP